MDPTAAIPLHFTLESLAVAGGGVLLAWALVRRRWVAAVGSALLVTSEALHAGRFLATDDEPALVAMRFAAVGLLSVVAVRAGTRRPLYAAGSAVLVAGAAWGAIVGGGLADPSIGPHVLIAVGSIMLAAWASLASRDSIRLRVLTALVGMLAIAVVAGGGAVSRVAALDKRNENLRQLGSALTAARAGLTESSQGLSRRAALVSPLISNELSASGGLEVARASLQREQAEFVAVLDRGGVRAVASTNATVAAYGNKEIATNAAVRSALRGQAANDFDVARGRLFIIATSPVFRPAAQATTEVIGAVAMVQSRSPASLRDAARSYAPGAEVALVGVSSAASDPSLLGVQRPEARNGVVFERVTAGNEERLSAGAILGADGVGLVVVGSDAGMVEAAAGLLRALLLGILAAAILAVVAALWLSARVTRPILDLAEGAEQVKADFLASLSHELRTPLTPIRGYTEILRRGRVPARRAADYLDEIGEAAGRLERIVTLLIDVAAQETGRFDINARDLHPEELLLDAAERWKRHSRRHPVRVVAPRSVPRVHADPDVLGRVLDELIDNAVKFSPRPGGIELRSRRTKDGVEISVTDAGIGISDEQAGELTRAFAQAESGDRRRYGGLGLGLAFVSGVLDAHGTRLSLHSEPGVGTTFSFTLPTAGMVSRMPARAAQRGSQPEAGTR